MLKTYDLGERRKLVQCYQRKIPAMNIYWFDDKMLFCAVGVTSGIQRSLIDYSLLLSSHWPLLTWAGLAWGQGAAVPRAFALSPSKMHQKIVLFPFSQA